MQKKYRLTITLSTFVVLLFIICALYLTRSNSTTSSLDLAKNSDAVRDVSALGYLEPIARVIKVGAPSSQDPTATMKVQELKVAEGDTVTPGDLLAILDSTPRLRAAVKEAQSTLKLRHDQLDKIEVDSRLTVVQQKEIVAKREVASRMAQRELNRHEVLFPQGAVSEKEFDDKRLAAQVARNDLREAIAVLKKTEAVDKSNLLTDIGIALDELALAQVGLERAEFSLDASFVKAPSPGRIIHILVQPGEQIPSGGALLELADVSRMGIRIEVDQTDAAHIKVGQAVSASGQSNTDIFNGRVIQIADYIKRQTIFESDASARVDGRSVEIWARLDDESILRAAKQINAQVRVRFAASRTGLQ